MTRRHNAFMHICGVLFYGLGGWLRVVNLATRICMLPYVRTTYRIAFDNVLLRQTIRQCAYNDGY